jgi:DNA-binding CsgD family transcriptional regulator
MSDAPAQLLLRPQTAREFQSRLKLDRGTQPYLLWRNDAHQLCFRPLVAQGGPVVIGRAADVDIQLGWDRCISRVHVELAPIATRWSIRDDGLSTNGTFVNAERLRGRRLLASGDRILLGSTLLLYRLPHPSEVSATTRANGHDPLAQLTPAQLRVLRAVATSARDHDGWPAGPDDLASRLHLSRDTVKTHLRALYERFAVEDVPRDQKRARLAQMALELGVAE